MSTEVARVRTRFAPSPTGALHIGGVRTALYCALYAWANGGDFILRIEDTDRDRSKKKYVRQIMRTLKALNIPWSEGPDVGGPYGPYTQSERLPLYHKHADELLKKGHLYKCFCSKQRLEEVDAAAKAKNRPTGYDRHCRNLSPEDVAGKEAAGMPFVIRMKVPYENVVVNDLLRKEVHFKAHLHLDPIMIKSDGFPTYHFAVVVDDHYMGITHVLRGSDDWLNSAPLHVLLYKFFGWQEPVWVHLPLVLGDDGEKLSKRHGDTAAEKYIAKGYLPEALVNYMALVGWNPGGNREFMDLKEMTACFDLKRIQKAGGRFDIVKLNRFNLLHMRKLTDEELVGRIIPFLIKARVFGGLPRLSDMKILLKAVPELRNRIKTLKAAVPYLRYLFWRPEPKKSLIAPRGSDKAKVLSDLASARNAISGITNWSVNSVETTVRALVAASGDEKHMFRVLRGALTGAKESLPLFETIEILGAMECIARIDGATALLS